MIEAMVGVLTTMLTVMIVGLVVAAVSMALWLVFLPFKLLGFMFKGLGLVLALPILLVFGALGFLVFGIGMFVFMIPCAPFLLVAYLVWRWMRGRPRATVSA
jgi:hypothetical protein